MGRHGAGPNCIHERPESSSGIQFCIGVALGGVGRCEANKPFVMSKLDKGQLKQKYQQGVNVRLAGPGGSPMTWSLADPVVSDGWGSSQIAMVRRLTPHIRQFIRVRQALVRAQAGDTTVTALLDNPRIGVLHLDRRGRILAVNDRARSLLRHGEALSDEEGVLQARAPDDQVRLARLVAEALPTSSAVAVSGSMLLARAAGVPPLVVHVKPVGIPQPDYGARPVAALVLLVEPGGHPRLDPDVVARTRRWCTAPQPRSGGRASMSWRC